jgi:hypothetical protein
MTRRSRTERSATNPPRNPRTPEPGRTASESPITRDRAPEALATNHSPARTPLARDRWAWIAALSVLPLVLHSWGAPLGEPFADDYDYLHRALLESNRSWLDGGGFALYWRPLGRQAYFGALGPALMTAPWIVPVLHVVLLALAAVLVHRALAPRLGAPAAATAASFVPLMESTRMLIAWPSHFMDVGALLFAALAMHEASRERFRFAIPAAIASLLCKEVGALALLLLPWMPASPAWTIRRRLGWTIALLLGVASWGMVYAWIARRAGFAFAGAGRTEGASLPMRFGWALAHGVRAGFSLPESGFASSRAGVIVIGTLAALGVGCVVRVAFDAGARTRLAQALPWSAWGIAWFALASLPLAAVYPTWSPYRSAFAGAGAGVAIAAPLAAIDARALAVVAGARLLAFALSPRPPQRIAERPSEYGAAYDFERLVRLERLVGGTRRLLAERHSHLPRGAAVGHHHLPQLTRFAFTGGKALRVWYRDTTLRWVDFENLRERVDPALVTIVEYQPQGEPQLALVEPDAMRAMLEAGAALDRQEWSAALARLDRADSLQQDRAALVFRSLVQGKRALAHAYRRETDAAEGAARRSLALWRGDTDARLVLAGLWSSEGRLREAMDQIDSLLAVDPGDQRALDLGAQIRAAAGRGQ